MMSTDFTRFLSALSPRLYCEENSSSWERKWDDWRGGGSVDNWVARLVGVYSQNHIDSC